MSDELKPQEAENEVESLNETALNPDDMSLEDLEEASGGGNVSPSCTVNCGVNL